jgi:hypothetical protein
MLPILIMNAGIFVAAASWPRRVHSPQEGSLLSKRTFLVLIAVPLLLAVVACGGKSKSSDTSSTPTGNDSAASATQASNSGNGGSSSNNNSSSSDASLANCPQFANFVAAATKGFGGASGSTAKFDKKALDDMVKAAPSAIKADVQVMADGLGSYFDALNKLGVDLNDPQSFSKLDATKLQQLQDAVAKLDTQKFTDASNRVEAFFQKNCS